LGGIAVLGLGGIAAGATGNAAYFGIGGLFGILGIAIAIASIAFAYGAWMLLPWAWSLGIVIELVSIVFAVVSIIGGGSVISNIVSVVIGGVIIYYLNQPHVRAAFGKTAA